VSEHILISHLRKLCLILYLPFYLCVNHDYNYMNRVNGITLLVAAILLAEDSSVSIEQRTAMLYRLMDFDASGEITMEEMVRLILMWITCLLNSLPLIC